MGFLMDLIKGLLMGVANVIPGVSGGTMAVSLGIYDKFIGGLSGFTRDWKKSVMTLLPIVIGMGIGILSFSYIIPYCLEKYMFATCLTFIGLILGGVPALMKDFKSKREYTKTKLGIAHVIAFIVLFAIAVGLPMLGTGVESTEVITASFGKIIILFLVGTVAAATMVIPGVSGSLVLMILGYYYGILNTIKDFLHSVLEMNMSGIINGFSVIFPFGVGVLIGVVGIAKAIEYLFEKHSVITYSAIFGLIAASPIAIFYNTGLYKDLGSVSILSAIAGIVLAIAGAALTSWLGKIEV